MKTIYYSIYSISNANIIKVDNIKGQGIIFENKLKFNIYVDTISIEAKRLINFIFNQLGNIKIKDLSRCINF